MEVAPEAVGDAGCLTGGSVGLDMAAEFVGHGLYPLRAQALKKEVLPCRKSIVFHHFSGNFSAKYGETKGLRASMSN
jgi:hypothetical protein